MEPELAEKYPQIKTYRVRAAADPSVTGRVDMGPNGFHAYLATADGIVFINPVTPRQPDHYVSFYKHDYAGAPQSASSSSFSCRVRPSSSAPDLLSKAGAKRQTVANDEIRVYRLAAATTGEYSQAVAGGNAVNTLAELVTAINRLNQIFERDLGVRMLLVANNDSLVYTDPDTDPYSNLNLNALLDENQANTDDVIGSANYDIGHVFSTSDGGLANIGSACSATEKAGGATGIDNPVGDAFYIDFLAHELGHQFGANHSYNGTTAQCGNGNRNAATAFEPGSGSTIMSYGGICDEENVQEDPDPQSPDQGYMDPTFHAGSIEQILNFVQGGTGSSCPSSLATGNIAPLVDAGPDITIPGATAFNLNGTVTDANGGDILLHQWDQMDAGFRTDSTTYGTDLVTNALFRSFVPVGAASRSLPQLSTLLGGVPDKAETLPTTSRTLTFRLTSRDNRGGVADDDLSITVDNSKGPFAILQPNTTQTLNTLAPQVVEWNAACTEMAPINCSTVDISLSTDGGMTFNTLLSSVPNDGEQSVVFPASTSAAARIKVACSSNIFFDIADTDFSLAQDGSGVTLTSTGNGGSNSCGTGNPLGADIETNDTPASAQSISVPFSVNGTANSTTDVDDYFVFTVDQPNRTFVLSLSIPNDPTLNTNNHDLFLLDSSGTNEIAQSTKPNSLDESISITLDDNSTYYVRVTARDTIGQNSTYALSITSSSTNPPPTGGKGGGGGALDFIALMLLWLFAVYRLNVQCGLRAPLLKDCDQSDSYRS